MKWAYHRSISLNRSNRKGYLHGVNVNEIPNLILLKHAKLQRMISNLPVAFTVLALLTTAATIHICFFNTP